MDCNAKFKTGKHFLSTEELTKSEIKRKEYKKKYFQDNKEKISLKRKANPVPTEKSRKYNFRYQYGISLEDYEVLLKEQNYKCATCFKPHGEKGKARLHVDHNHKTNKIRGLLCHSCNVSLGLMNDDEFLLKNLISYLQKHGTQTRIDTKNS